MKSKILFYRYITKIILFALFFGLTQYSYSQHQNKTYRIFLKDKGPIKFEKGTPLYDSTIKLYNKRAIERRLKVKSENELFTFEDAPVYEYYIETIKSLGAKVLLKLRWDNYIVVSCDSITLATISDLPFVKKIQATSSKLIPLSIKEIENKEENFLKEIINEDYYNCDDFDYGESYIQNNIINVLPLHSIGVTGQGVIIGLMDSGFNTKMNRALKRTNIIAEKDFIFDDSVVSNQELDTVDQEGHGTLVLSTISGYDPGFLIGTAPSVSFLLAKTEYLPTERHLEEDNYACAVEWFESSGADIISSSLGYLNFDSTDENYSYDELDGRTTIVSRAINRAVERGVVCISAAGNTGPREKTIHSPADADSVIAVASVTSSLAVPDFSSRGPRSDGKLKPEIASMGVQVVCAPPQWLQGIIKVNGTSMATPQIAGAVALILSAFPELTPYEVRKSLYIMASNYHNPDIKIGYGIANTYESAKFNGIIISPMITYRIKEFQRLAFFIISTGNELDAELYIRFSNKTEFDYYKLYKSSIENLYTADIPINLFNDSLASAFIIAKDWTLDGKKTLRRAPFNKTEFFVVEPNSIIIPCGIKKNLLPVIDENKTNSYVYPSVISNINNNISINIPLISESNIDIKIYNSLGQNIYNYLEYNRSSGVVNIPIDIRELASGAYFAVIKYHNKSEILTFIITR